jgi:hypothetical protein
VGVVQVQTAPAWRPRAERLAEHELTPRGVIVLVTVLLAGATALELRLTDRLGLFFAISFVLTVLTAALLVRSDGFYPVGVLPPLLMFAVLVAVAWTAPQAIQAHGLAVDAGTLQRVIAGTVNHATPLAIGHVLVLLVIGARIRAAAPAPSRR